jgi:uncharacterized protein (TIGR02246 family)
MLRSFITVAVAAVGLAMPAAAEQVSEQDAWKAGQSVVEAFNRAAEARDAAGLARLYSEDALFITTDGPVYGRAAIQKMLTDEQRIYKAEPAKLDRVVMIGDAARLRTGSWSGVLQTPNGPMHLKGYWTTTDVRDGDTWKIRMETDNMTMPPPPLEASK